jgi:hypothetical protein
MAMIASPAMVKTGTPAMMMLSSTEIQISIALPRYKSVGSFAMLAEMSRP